jgi:hypothetical protein
VAEVTAARERLLGLASTSRPSSASADTVEYVKYLGFRDPEDSVLGLHTVH